MNFAGINLDSYMKGNSFGTEQQNALQDAATMAHNMGIETAGKLGRTNIRNKSALAMAEAEKKAGGQISAMMGPANFAQNLAGIGTTAMTTDWGSLFGGGGGAYPVGRGLDGNPNSYGGFGSGSIQDPTSTFNSLGISVHNG